MVWFLEKEEGGMAEGGGGRGGRGQQEEGMRVKEEQRVYDRRRIQVCVKKWRRRWGSKRVEDLEGFEGTGRQLLQHRIKMKFSDGLLHWLMALPDGSHQRDQAQRCVCPSVYVLVYFCLCVFLWLHICIKKKVISKKALYWKHGPLAARPPPSCLFISLNWLCGRLPLCASHHLPSLFQNFGSIHIRFTFGPDGNIPSFHPECFTSAGSWFRKIWNKISGQSCRTSRIWDMRGRNNVSAPLCIFTSLIVVWGGQQKLEWGNFGLLGSPRGPSDMGQRAKPTMAVLKYTHGRTLH